MIIQTIDESRFVGAFRDYGRYEDFSRAGLCALFEYLEELFPGDNNPYELDVIALCCEYSEFDSLEDLEEEYAMSLETIQENTTVLEIGQYKKDPSYIVGEF